MSNSLLVLIVGLPGTGKSTLAKRLADVFDCTVITTEVVRSQLFNENQIMEDRDFTQEELDITYRAIALLCENLLAAKARVIVDGVFRSQSERNKIIDIAQKNNAKFIGIYTYSKTDDIVLDRLRRRKQMGTASPAGDKAYYKIKKEFESVDPSFLQIDTTQNQEIAEQ